MWAGLMFCCWKGEVILLTVMKDKEIMTVWDAVMKYKEKWIYFVVTDKEPTGYRSDDDLGYVVFLADTDSELASADISSYRGMSTICMPGYSATGPYPQIGGIEREYRKYLFD